MVSFFHKLFGSAWAHFGAESSPLIMLPLHKRKLDSKLDWHVVPPMSTYVECFLLFFGVFFSWEELKNRWIHTSLVLKALVFEVHWLRSLLDSSILVPYINLCSLHKSVFGSMVLCFCFLFMCACFSELSSRNLLISWN